MGLLILIAFVSGILTIFSPCVWPILPVVLSSSWNKGAFYALSLTGGIISSFIILTFGLSFLMKAINLNPQIFRLLSLVIIILSGLTMIFPRLQQLLETIAHIHPANSDINKDLGGFLTGVSLGILWTPCAGPILITISMVAANQIVNVSIFILLMFYALGTAFPIFIYALAEQWLFAHNHRLIKLTRTTQVSAGIIMIISVILIYTHYDKVFWTKFSPLLPFIPKNITQLEEMEPVHQQLEILKKRAITPTLSLPTPTISPLPTTIPAFPQAPEINGIVKWFNTENGSPILLEQLKGRVILLDFWTYTCLSCIPTIEFLKQLAQKYPDLIIIGIHTPGYAEAKLAENVKAAIDRYQIPYPIAMDNDWRTFDAYKNNYWPTEYLIDKDGFIRFRHEGGGEYEKIEAAVKELLKI